MARTMVEYWQHVGTGEVLVRYPRLLSALHILTHPTRVAYQHH